MGREEEGKGGERKGGRGRTGGGHHFIGLLGMFTLKKCGCSSLRWCLLVRGREGGGKRGRWQVEGITSSGCSGCLL